LRDYLRKVFKPIDGPDGENDDTDYEDYEYDGDRSPRNFAFDLEIGNDGDEEGDRSLTPRIFVANPVVARPSRRVHSSPSRQNHTARQPTGYRRSSGQENIIMDVDPTVSPAQPANGAVHPPSNRPVQYATPSASSGSHALSNGGVSGPSVLNGGRLRGFGQQPLVEPPPPTSPTPSETASERSNGTAHSHGAGFYKSYHEAVAAASSSRHHVLTPDLNYAEIGHGRGTTDSDNSAEPTSTISAVRGYDMNAPQVVSGEQDYVLLDSSNLYLHPTEREGSATWNQRQRDRGLDESSATTPTAREQELNQNALASSAIGLADARGRTGKRGWRNTLNVAEQYASSLLFGGRGGTVGLGGSSSGVPE
jgi:F-box and leucine-rich repeat protein GRR1